MCIQHQFVFSTHNSNSVSSCSFAVDGFTVPAPISTTIEPTDIWVMPAVAGIVSGLILIGVIVVAAVVCYVSILVPIVTFVCIVTASERIVAMYCLCDSLHVLFVII